MTRAFFVICRHEWRVLCRDAGVGLAAVGVAAVVVAAIVAGGATAESVRARVLEVDRARSKIVDGWREKATDWYGASATPLEVAAPPGPLAWLAVGQSDLAPPVATAFTWAGPDAMFAKVEPQNPALLRVGRLDAAFVAIYLLPLLAIVVAYDLLTAEREQGTLALVLSQPLSLATLLAAKVAVRAVVVLGVVTLSAGAAAAWHPINAGSELWIAWLAVAAYVLLWLVLSAGVNLLVSSSAAGVLALGLVWLLSVIVVPAVANSALSLAIPEPPRSTLIIGDRAADLDVSRRGRVVLDRYYHDHPELAPADPANERGDRRRQLLLLYLEHEAALRQVAAPFDAAVAARQRQLAAWAMLSPALVLQSALTTLAGTGPDDHRRFREAAVTYVDRQRAFFVPRIVQAVPASGSDYAAFPDFEPRPAGNRLASAALDTAQLLFVTAVAALAVARGCRRYFAATP